MPPEAAALRVLAAALAEDLEALRKLDAVLEKFSATLSEAAWDDAAVWASAGVLHGIYNAFENSFLRISDTFGDKIDRSTRWHAELLHRMFLNIPDLRAPVLPPSTRELMKELLGFRHLYRHGYDLELSAAKLAELVHRWSAGREEVTKALGCFRLDVLRAAVCRDT